jgi:hypothetical protein
MKIIYPLLMLLIVIGCSSSDPKVPFYEAEVAYKEGNLDEAFKLFDETLLFINEMDPEDELYTNYMKSDLTSISEIEERFGKEYSNVRSYDKKEVVRYQKFVNDYHPYLKEISTYKNGLLPSSLFLRRLGHAGPYDIASGEYYESLKNNNNEWKSDYQFRLHELRTSKKIANAYFKQGDYDKFLWMLETNPPYELRITGKEFYEYATVLSDKNKLQELKRLSHYRKNGSNGWCETIPTWENDIIDSKGYEVKRFRLGLDMLVFKYLAGDTQNSLDAIETLYKEKKKESAAALKFVYLGYIAVAYSKCEQKEKSDEIFTRLENMAPFTAEQMTSKMSEEGMTDYDVPALESVYLHLTKMYAKAGIDKPLIMLKEYNLNTKAIENVSQFDYLVRGEFKYLEGAIVKFPVLLDLQQNIREKKNKASQTKHLFTQSGRQGIPTNFVLDLAEIYNSQGKNNLSLELLNNFMKATIYDINEIFLIWIGGMGYSSETGMGNDSHRLSEEMLLRFVDLYLSLAGKEKTEERIDQLYKNYRIRRNVFSKKIANNNSFHIITDSYGDHFSGEGGYPKKKRDIKTALQLYNEHIKNYVLAADLNALFDDNDPGSHHRTGFAFRQVLESNSGLPELAFKIAYLKVGALEKSRLFVLKEKATHERRRNIYNNSVRSYININTMNGKLFTIINYLLKINGFDDAANLIEREDFKLSPFDKVSGLVEIGKAYHQNKNFEMSKKYFDKAMLQAEFIAPKPPSFLLAEIMVAYAKSGHIDELKKVYSAMPDYVYGLSFMDDYNPDYNDIWENQKVDNNRNDEDNDELGLYKYEAILMSIPKLFKKDDPDKSWELFTEFSKMIHDMPDGPFFDEGHKDYNKRLYYLGGWKPILISDLVIEWYNVFGNDENDKMMPFIEQTIQDMISKDPFPFYYSMKSLHTRSSDLKYSKFK